MENTKDEPDQELPPVDDQQMRRLWPAIRKTEGSLMEASECKFFVGQVVHHRLFHYRGVIFDVDPAFHGSESWYRQMARSHPPKDKPWYHVLVSGSENTTYVAERNLETDPSRMPVEHPALEQLFSEFRSGRYTPRLNNN